MNLTFNEDYIDQGDPISRFGGGMIYRVYPIMLFGVEWFNRTVRFRGSGRYVLFGRFDSAIWGWCHLSGLFDFVIWGWQDLSGRSDYVIWSGMIYQDDPISWFGAVGYWYIFFRDYTNYINLNMFFLHWTVSKLNAYLISKKSVDQTSLSIQILQVYIIYEFGR